MKLKDKIIYYIISISMSIIGYFPVSLNDFLAEFLGSFLYTVGKKHRKITLNNLRNAFAGEKSEKEIKILARKVFHNVARMIFEHAKMHNTKLDDLVDQIEISGYERAKKIFDRKKGFLVYTGHLGNWELLTILRHLAQVPCSVVYKRLESEPFNEYIKKKRKYSGCTLLQQHRAIDHVLAALDRKEAVGLVVDQNVRKRHRGVFIDFFGRKTIAEKGLARLALSTKAPVVPVFSYRVKGKFHFDILPSVPLIETGDLEKDIQANTQAYHSIIEQYIRKYPDQWFWVHNRWKTRPLEEL